MTLTPLSSRNYCVHFNPPPLNLSHNCLLMCYHLYLYFSRRSFSDQNGLIQICHIVGSRIRTIDPVLNRNESEKLIGYQPPETRKHSTLCPSAAGCMLMFIEQLTEEISCRAGYSLNKSYIFRAIQVMIFIRLLVDECHMVL